MNESDINTTTKKQKKGVYTPNKCMLFILLLLILLLPFSENNLLKYTHTIKQPPARKISAAITESIIDLSIQIHTATISTIIREKFLTYTGLDTRPEWDSFFYASNTDNQPVSTEPDTAVSAEPNKKKVPRTAVSEQHSNTELQVTRNRTVAAPVQKTKRAYYTKQILVPYSTEHPLRLLLFGDSQMYYLASGMRRALGENTAIQIKSLSVHSSGFLRSDYYNWQKKLHTLLSSQNRNTAFHAAVVLLGMNDYQDVYSEGRIIESGTAEWQQVYRKKVRQHITTVLQFVPVLYRLGLPHVRNKQYDKKIVYMDKIQKEVAQEFPGSVINLSFEEITNGLGTGYLQAIQNGTGSWVHFMQDDGIHYSIPGSEYIMKQLLQHINEDFLFE